MSQGVYLSQHKDSQVAFWLVAHVHELDTHVLWSAKAFTKRDDEASETSFWLFQKYFCDSEILHELIKRNLVVGIERQSTEHIQEKFWEELQETVNACEPFISFPLNEEAEEYAVKYREPKPRLWFEIVIDTFTEELVRFSFSLWGYKYLLDDLTLDKQNYYLFADRLDARIRFVNNWFPLESLCGHLRSVMERKSVLLPVRTDLDHEISMLRKPTDLQIRSSCRSLFPLLERVLREYSSAKGWSGKSANLDQLISQFAQAKELSGDSIELLRFIAKPKRDYIQHGRDIPLPIGKVVLATLIELFARFGRELPA